MVEGHKATGSRWAFSWKVDQYEMSVKAKATLLVKGDRQIAGVGFHETFAPTLSTSTIRLLVALANGSIHELFQLYFEQAFTHSPSDEENLWSFQQGVAITRVFTALNRHRGVGALRW